MDLPILSQLGQVTYPSSAGRADERGQPPLREQAMLPSVTGHSRSMVRRADGRIPSVDTSVKEDAGPIWTLGTWSDATCATWCGRLATEGRRLKEGTASRAASSSQLGHVASQDRPAADMLQAACKFGRPHVQYGACTIPSSVCLARQTRCLKMLSRFGLQFKWIGAIAQPGR